MSDISSKSTLCLYNKPLVTATSTANNNGITNRFILDTRYFKFTHTPGTEKTSTNPFGSRETIDLSPVNIMLHESSVPSLDHWRRVVHDNNRIVVGSRRRRRRRRVSSTRKPIGGCPSFAKQRYQITRRDDCAAESRTSAKHGKQ